MSQQRSKNEKDRARFCKRFKAYINYCFYRDVRWMDRKYHTRITKIDGALTGHFIFACVGVVMVPLGVAHGIWLWF